MMKRKVLTVGEKAEIIMKLENGEKNSVVCKMYGLSSSTVSTLWKNRDTILKAFQNNITESKRLKRCEKPDLDEALAKWCRAQMNAGLPLNGTILKKQAFKIAAEFGYQNFLCTNGWMERFKSRHNISYAKTSKAKKPNPSANLTDNMTDWIQNMWQNYKQEQVSEIYSQAQTLLSDTSSNSTATTEWLETMWLDYRSQYGEDDIYNAEEVGLFYGLTPDRMQECKELKCRKGELAQERLSVFLCTNMSGTDKRKLLIIGSLTNPSCFANVKALPADYVPNPKAWMTPQIFVSHVHKWDSEMRKKQRRIILLIDNGTAHSNISNLTNIKLVFLPPNSVSALQPLHQGIIRSFKTNYRKELLFLLNDKEIKRQNPPVTVLEAIRMMHDAWYDVTSDCIRHCFVKAMLQSEIGEDDSRSFSKWMVQNKIEIFREVEDIDDFGKFDDGLFTSGIPTVQEIVAEMKTSNTTDDDDSNDDTNEIPTLTTAIEGAHSLQCFLESKSSTDDEIFKAISLIKHKLRQFRDNSTEEPKTGVSDDANFAFNKETDDEEVDERANEDILMLQDEYLGELDS